LKEEIFQEVYKHYLADYKLGETLETLSKKFGYENKESFRWAFKNERNKRGIPSKIYSGVKNDYDEEINYRSSEEIKSDGSITSDKLIKICELDKNNPDVLMSAHGFNPEEFSLVYAKNNYWHMMKKGGDRLILYQSKITVKPKIASGLTLEIIDQWFANNKNNISKRISQPKQYDENEKVLEICLADTHEGRPEILLENSVELRERIEFTIDYIVNKISNQKFSKIYFVPLGDMFHFDGASNKTTGGTQMETNGKTFAKMFDDLANSMIFAIEKLAEIAPVEVPWIGGNHDMASGYYLIKALEFYFKNNENVKIDSSHLSRKFRRIGKSLIGWAHGDSISKNSAGDWLQVEARKEWSMANEVEVHMGHLHTEQTIEKTGMIVRYLPAICAPDGWSYSKGFVGAKPKTCCFIWDLETGLDDIFYAKI